MSPLELVLFGAFCYLFGLVSGAVLIHRNHPYFDGAEQSTMTALAAWVVESDKLLTF